MKEFSQLPRVVSSSGFSSSRVAPLVAAITFAVIGLFVAPGANAVTAYEAPLGSWSANSYGFSLNTEYFTSKANYDQTRGSYVRLQGDNSFSNLTSTLRARYNVTGRISAYMGGSYGYSHALDSSTDKTNAQMTNAFVGADYILTKRHLHLVPEIEAGFALDRADPLQSAPLTSDGVPYARVGLFAHKPFRYLRIGAYGGAQVRGDGLASLFLYEGTVDVRLFLNLTVGGGIDGYETMVGDQETYGQRYQTALRADAGSERFYSYNPSLLEARAWVGFRPDNSLWVRIGYAKTLNGTNSGEGQSFLLSIAFNTPKLASPGESDVPPRARLDQDAAMKSFEPDMENTEQGIFDEQEREIVPGSGATTKPAPQKIKARDTLDSTEKMLEKKTEEGHDD